MPEYSVKCFASGLSKKSFSGGFLSILFCRRDLRLFLFVGLENVNEAHQECHIEDHVEPHRIE